MIAIWVWINHITQKMYREVGSVTVDLDNSLCKLVILPMNFTIAVIYISY